MTGPDPTVIRIESDEQALRCFPVFHELRPHLDEAVFMDRWRAQRSTGYEIVAIEADSTIAAAAGFRELTTMAWGRILYLDDLIALPRFRGSGLGSRLLEHVQALAVERGCAEVHLDTGHSRHDAHRSYLRNGFDIVCHHLSWSPPVLADTAGRLT